MKPLEGSTVIGKSVVVRGELSGREDLYMDGDMEGVITLEENSLTVGPNARVVANINARDIIVMGKVKGTLNASGRVELRQSASIIGDISAARLSMEDGATIQGKVELKTADSQQRTLAQPAASVQETLILQPRA
jgi:cytoskeletal protein CcmA (bactofilin family)